ncbi:YkgJ family cysteine cluster protein [Shewanella violacea]|nr:YkgJ family cysteine cluster protein [Shewanella violacea]
MTIIVKNIQVAEVTCSNCQACCCSSEVMILSETGVPDQHIYVDMHGNESMLRLDDGWCSALDRDTLMCSIYEYRPWICREFDMGGSDCIDERIEKM